VAFLGDRRLVGLLIAIGVVLIVVLTMIGFSGAYFTSSSRSPGNEFKAGAVSLSLSQPGAVVDGAGMIPGDIRTGDQTVINTGHRAKLVLDVRNLDTQSALTAVLDVQVQQTLPPVPTPAYDGPLAGLDRVNLGTFARDETRTYMITVTWPSRDDSLSLRGTQTSLDFHWQMASVT
jgi:hypothetical protein